MSKISELFVGWYNYSDEDFQNILKNGWISFDTNVLLNLYRYSKEASEKTLSMFKSVSNRLFFTYYVAFEFTKNRQKVEYDSLNEYNGYKKKIEAKYCEIVNEINNISKNKMPNKEKLISSVEKSKDKIINSIETELAKKESLFKDGLEEKICNLFDNRILEKHSLEEFEKMKEEGKRRIKEQVPPGYKDEKKGENGDYYIFKQLMDYSKSENKDIIFVTDDEKEDMFQNINGIKNPRPELLQEFFENTGHKIVIMTLEKFLNNKSIFSEKLSDEILDEIKTTSRNSEYAHIRIQLRVRKFMYRAFKHNTIDDIESNIDMIESSIRTIIRILSGFGDNNAALEYEYLLSLLDKEDYDTFIENSLNQRQHIEIVKQQELEKIKFYHQTLNYESSKTDIISALTTFLSYIDCFLDNSYDNRNQILHIREIRNALLHDLITNEKAIDELNSIYDSSLEGDACVSL